MTPGASQEQYIQILCKEREVDTDLELEIHELYDLKRKLNDFPVRDASRIIDKLRACLKKGKVALGSTGGKRMGQRSGVLSLACLRNTMLGALRARHRLRPAVEHIVDQINQIGNGDLMEACDLDGSVGLIDITDLEYLADYMFIAGPARGACPWPNTARQSD